MQYPLQEIIRTKSDEKGITAIAVAEYLGIERRTLYTFKSFKDLSLDRILKLSEILDFDLLTDYMKRGHLYTDEQLEDMHVKEPGGKYTLGSKLITTTLNLVATMQEYEKNYIEMLKDIEKTAFKYGFELK